MTIKDWVPNDPIHEELENLELSIEWDKEYGWMVLDEDAILFRDRDIETCVVWFYKNKKDL